MCFSEGGRELIFSELSRGFQKQEELLHSIPLAPELLAAEPKVLLEDFSYGRAKIFEP